MDWLLEKGVISAGFVIGKILEPMPTEQFKIGEPEKYDRLRLEPQVV